MTTALSSVLSLFEDGLTVADLVRHQQVFTLDGQSNAASAHDQLTKLGFDQAPLRDAPIRRFVRRRALADARGPVEELSEDILPELRISETMSMLEAFERLRDREFLFATHREHVTGLITRSDLGQPSASLLGLGLITATEQALDEIIEKVHGDRWRDKLSASRAAKVSEVYAERQRHNAELSPLRALNLEDRLSLVGSAKGMPQALGFSSKTAFTRWGGQLKRIRNCLAHGDGLLGAVPDPEEALKELHHIREFALQAADVVSEG
jgi:hypothetical protein